MSIPPRPLLRSRWAWVAREHIRKHLKLSPNSRHFASSTPQHVASVPFRRAHSSFADTDAPITPARAFPIDVIEHQATVRQFYASIEAGKSEKAREILFDLVDRHTPDSSLDVFRQLRSIVVHSENPDVNIILALGLSLASKGYADFVKDEIIPTVQELGSTHVFSRFQAILTELKETKPKPKTMPHVFEEASDDYANVLSRFPLPPPSVMELIREQLSPMLPDQSTTDQSIFEEQTVEYSLHASSHTKEYHGHTSASILLDLVMDRRFEEAYYLLEGMEDLKTPIPPSHLYEVAALDALRNTALSAEQRVDRFTAFFSLIPPIHTANPPRDFAEVRYRILQSPSLNLTLLRRCALVLASKGYTNKFLRQFLPTIFFYDPPTNYMKFILELERRTLNYWLELAPVKALERTRYASENIRGVAVCCMAYGGHIEEALNLINNPKVNNGITFPVHIYDVLLKRLLHPNHRRQYWHTIKSIDRLRAERQQADEARGRVRPSLKSIVLASTAEPFSPPADRTDLRAMLQYLRKAIFLDDPHRTLPSLLTEFMEAYSMTGRTLALQLLLEKALRRSQRASKLFLFAEMRYYREHQQLDLVIKTFVQHFQLAGVPREEVQRWYSQLEQGDREGDDSLTRLSGFNPHTVLRGGKLFPDLEQCHLVWEALIIKAQDDKGALMNLYKKFINYAKHAEDPTADPSLASVKSLPMTTRFGLSVSGPAFHAFMHHMLPYFGPDFGYTIINDMWSLDLWPGTYHYGTLARHYAHHGHLPQVFAIIDKLENGTVLEDRPQRFSEDATEQESQLEQSPSKAVTKVPLFMQPDAPFYINIMQGLLYSMNADAAEEVHRRLQKRCPCEPGAYPPLDRALKKLADLKVLLAKSTPAPQVIKPTNALWSQPPLIINEEVARRRR